MFRYSIIGACFIYYCSYLLLLKERKPSDMKCPKCSHFSIQTNSVPEKYIYMVDALFKESKRFSDPNCENGENVATSCVQQISTDLEKVKCKTTNLTLKTNKFLPFLPDAEITFNLLLRDCMVARKSEPDRCFSLEDLNQNDRKIIIDKLLSIPGSNLENITMTGHICTKSLS
ncbi:hypothetical protein ACF0H5_005394 [Mactra antiquata]